MIPKLQTLEVFWFHRTKGRRARTHPRPGNWHPFGAQSVDALQLSETGIPKFVLKSNMKEHLNISDCEVFVRGRASFGLENLFLQEQ